MARRCSKLALAGFPRAAEGDPEGHGNEAQVETVKNVYSGLRSADGKWLATSGSTQVVLWPFAGKDGPMGKEPAMLAPLQAKVSAVACHPKNDILAAGYSDGTVLMVRMGDGAEILVRRNGTPPIAALAWNPKGTLLAFSDEDGAAGILPL